MSRSEAPGDVAVLTIVGGSSVSTPVLLEELGRAWCDPSLPSLEVRLWGRNDSRARAVAAHGVQRLRRLGIGDHRLSVRVSSELSSALESAEVVLCQVRPGGFLERARDEAFALSRGIPGDEGLVPSGLRAYLRSRGALDRLHRAIAEVAPDAALLHMTSPLGLTVARARRDQGLRAYGICELAMVTVERVRRAVEPVLQCGPLQVLHAGLNHRTWLHVFRDASGRDRRADVLQAIDDPELVRVDPEVIRREGAVPVHYLRLHYHRERELAAQRARPEPRGAELEGWARELEQAYAAGPDHPRVAELLGRRDVSWYADGVVPSIAAFFSAEERRISLNLPAGSGVPGIPAEAIVELPSRVSRVRQEPLPVEALPPGPQALMTRFVAYETAVLGLSEVPDSGELAGALRAHPWVDDDSVAEALASGLTLGAGALG